MKKKLLIIFLLLLTGKCIAYDFTVNGINYNKQSNGTSATVTFNIAQLYSGAVVIPETVAYDGKTYTVDSIGESAFSMSTKMTSVKIPNTIKVIGKEAFYLCEGLTSIEIPNSVKYIGFLAFDSCTNVATVKMPDSLEYMDVGAFQCCI